MDEVEEWRPIEGYEDYYEVSSWGRVKSLERIVETSDGRLYPVKERIRKLQRVTRGYLNVILQREGEHTNCLVSRLVAAAFIPNPENKPEVNHKDGNKTNNKVTNLEWVTPKENTAHAIKTGLMPDRRGCAVVGIHKDGYHGIFAKNTKEATYVLGKSNLTHICRCLYGRAKTAYGYKWYYYEEVMGA